jgi:predicted TIM-barrel fold metal-dependent hydrolase
MLPSDFFRRNVFIGFQEEDLGIQLRHHIGVDNLLWGSDYPHAESTFPKSREILERIFKGIPEGEKAKIAGANTAKLYRFN